MAPVPAVPSHGSPYAQLVRNHTSSPHSLDIQSSVRAATSVTMLWGHGWSCSARRSSLLEVTQKSMCAVRAKPRWSRCGPTWVRPPRPAPPGELRARPTSFRGGELLGLTARPIASPVDHNHLQLVVAVGEEAGHHAPQAVAGEASLLPLLRHPQALQQAALPPVIGLRDRGRPVRGGWAGRVSG